MFLGLLRADPGGQTIFTHRLWPPAGQPDRTRLGPPGRFAASPAKRHSRPPLPAPHL